MVHYVHFPKSKHILKFVTGRYFMWSFIIIIIVIDTDLSMPEQLHFEKIPFK